MINRFENEYDFLRNDYPACIVLGVHVYPTLEHAYQASKTDNDSIREDIRLSKSVTQARLIGRKVTLPFDWDDRRIDVMTTLVKQKFTEHLDLKLKLLLTEDAEIVQGDNVRDQFWSVDINGIGQNNLGKILMLVRDNIKASEGDAKAVFKKFLESENLGFVFDVW